jgi:pyrroline-5-carboxylate reductase
MAFVVRGSAGDVWRFLGSGSPRSELSCGRMVSRLSVVGGGAMGDALVSGLLSSGWPAAEITVVDRADAARHAARERHPGVVAAASAPDARCVVLAVKPQDAEEACRALEAPERVLSVVAGLPTQRIEGWLGGRPGVVRAMPNMAAQVRAGATALAPGRSADEAAMAWAEEILSTVGQVVRLSEDLLDAVTGMSGSGPAWVFLLAEALVEAGVRNGIPVEACRRLAYQTIAGSAALLLETGLAPEELREAVTSPGGTTAAGLSVLESRSVRSAFVEAVTAATERARQLGRR